MTEKKTKPFEIIQTLIQIVSRTYRLGVTHMISTEALGPITRTTKMNE